MDIYIIEKIWKIDSYKTVSQFTVEPFVSSRHNSKTELCRALLKYENEKKSVEIIYLQIF